MTPKERVYAALEHREPDRIPWGEHSIDYNVYEDILGRETLVQAKFRQTRAMWDGRRDEVIDSMKRDIVDFTLAMDLDMVPVNSVPHKDFSFSKPRQLDADTWAEPPTKSATRPCSR